MIEELKIVSLREDLPEHGLEAGDVGTIVHVYNQGDAYEVEFVTFDGETIAVVTLRPGQLREIGAREIAQSRALVAD